MSRRPSRSEKDQPLLAPPAAKKGTVHGRSSSVRRSLSLDWARSQSQTFFSLGQSPWSNYDDDKRHLELDMHDDGGNQNYLDLRSLKLQRRRRPWERYLIVLLAGALCWAMFGKHTREKLEDAKVRNFAPPRQLVSSIPLPSFRANLREDAGYVTSFPYGGYTNQLIEMWKLVHLGRLLDRTALIPELKPVHGEGSEEFFSKFFDMDAFAYYTNVSVVEWRHVKMIDQPGTQSEQLSCWGWRNENALHRYNVKTDFWPPPGQLTVPSSIETSMTFHAIEVLASQSHESWLNSKADEMYRDRERPPFPDKQLLCFDNLFYVPSTRFVGSDIDRSYSIEELAPHDPVWSKTGVHLKFSTLLNRIADELLISILGSASRPYVGVHLRQGDFVSLGRVSNDLLEPFKKAVESVSQELQRRENEKLSFWKSTKIGHTRLPVIFATDSNDRDFINQFVKAGWVYIDHLEFATAPRFGGWFPGLLDSVLLSRAVGFVGTKMSTFSYVAARRVESWNQGVSRIVG